MRTLIAIVGLVLVWFAANVSAQDNRKTLVLSGMIDGKYAIHAVLDMDKPVAGGNEVTGAYFYASRAIALPAFGTLGPQALRLETTNSPKELFEGTRSGDTFTGTWTLKGKKLPFVLTLQNAPAKELAGDFKCSASSKAPEPKLGPDTAELKFKLAQGKVSGFNMSGSNAYYHTCDTELDKGDRDSVRDEGNTLAYTIQHKDAGKDTCGFKFTRVADYLLVRNTGYAGCLCGARMPGHHSVLLHTKTGKCSIYGG